MDVHIGGVYALEKIANESPELHWPIIELLTNYVRLNAPWRPIKSPDDISRTILDDKTTDDYNFGERYCAEFAAAESKERNSSGIPIDIQVILTVLSRRNRVNENEDQKLNLSNTDLRHAKLGKMKLDNVILTGSNLRDVDGIGASLKGANMENTILVGATFGHAELQGAKFNDSLASDSNFYRAKLDGAEFHGVCLENAQFGESILRNVKFEDGAYLVKALFWNANLDGASFEFANITGANFDRTSIKGADLRGTMHSSPDQFKTAIKDQSTKFP